MEAKDLRTGNILLFEDKQMKVSSIHIDNTIRFAVPNGGSIGCFKIDERFTKPIPITEKLLFGFGFKKEDEQDELLDTFMYNKDNITRVEFSDKHKVLYWHDNYTSIYATKIEYVHQLQNLYFAITGWELIYK